MARTVPYGRVPELDGPTFDAPSYGTPASAPRPWRAGFEPVTSYGAKQGSRREGLASDDRGSWDAAGFLKADHVVGPAVTHFVIHVLAATMFALDYLGRGKSAELQTVYRLMNVAYEHQRWPGIIALYSTVLGITFVMLVFCLAVLWFLHYRKGENLTVMGPGRFGMLHIVSLVLVDMILAYLSASIAGLDEIYQVTSFLALTAIANLFMRLSHTTEWVTLIGAMCCRLGAILVLSLNISLTDMVLDNRSKVAFIIYAVFVLVLDMANVLGRIVRPLVEDVGPQSVSWKQWLRTFVVTFSAGTYPKVVPDGTPDHEAGKWVAMSSAVSALLHAIGLATMCSLVFTDTVDGYARVDFNVKNMFVWSRGWPYMRWFVPIMWGAPTLLYSIQALLGGFKQRWALSAFDTLSMPGTSLSVAIMDFCIVTLLGPLYMVTEWQELALVGMTVALADLFILNIASLDWHTHLFGALVPLMPFLFVVTRKDKINFTDTDVGLIAYMFALYALRSIFIFARSKVFGHTGQGIQCTDALTCCLGDKKSYWVFSTIAVPAANLIIAISVMAIVSTSPYYYTYKSEVMPATGITIAW